MATGIKAPVRELTSKDSEILKFNHNLSLLIYQLSKVYPDDHDLKVWSDKFEWSKSFNAKMICEMFVDRAGPYVKEIMTEDEQFFINFDYNANVQNPQYLHLLSKIIHLWQDTASPKLKKNIWKYFQTLITYGIKACRREDLLKILNQYRTVPITF